MPTSSVPGIQFTDAGLVLPQESDILDGVQADIDAAFGGGVNPALETPQGQIASSETAIIADKNNEFAYFVNQIDPQYATGRFQDAIARFYYIDRKGATSTVVNCILVGPANSPIAAGALAQDTSGNTYVLLGSVTIPSGGTLTTSSWANIATGPIACPAGTLTVVYQSAGFDTITNPADGVIGQNVETPSEFEFRRKNSVAANSHGTPPSIYANVFEVDNVLDCYVIDNPADTIISSNPLPGGTPNPTNYPLAAHSIYVAVIGGTDADIANAIWTKKDGGCDYNGNTTVTVNDTSYTFPQPAYLVKFERPSALPIKFAVQIVNSPTLAPDIVTQIRTAIIVRFNGTDGTSRERIGGTILASRYYGAIASVASNIVLLSVLVGTSSPTLTNVGVGIDQAPTLSSSDISVTLI